VIRESNKQSSSRDYAVALLGGLAIGDYDASITLSARQFPGTQLERAFYCASLAACLYACLTAFFCAL